jgi:hypothetical protein
MPGSKQLDRKVIRLGLHVGDASAWTHGSAYHGVPEGGQWQIAQRGREKLGWRRRPRSIKDSDDMASQTRKRRSAQGDIVEQEVGSLM